MVMVLLVMLIFGLFSVSAQAQEIKIGLISSLTGPVSTYGQSVRNAVKMGVEEINNAGGINGQRSL